MIEEKMKEVMGAADTKKDESKEEQPVKVNLKPEDACVGIGCTVMDKVEKEQAKEDKKNSDDNEIKEKTSFLEALKGKVQIVTKGFVKENPALVLLLGACPFLATTTGAINGMGMGVSTMTVLICSNIVISILKNIIPAKVRIPAYIVVIAGFVTMVQFILKAYLPALDAALGLFIPLIVVNCIILGRAEMFASKNSIIDSALDGIGMGLGFTMALTLMGLIRELIGAGTAFDIPLFGENFVPMAMFMLAPGGFFVFAILVAGINYVTSGKLIKKKDFSCSGCAMEGMCGAAQNEEGGTK